MFPIHNEEKKIELRESPAFFLSFLCVRFFHKQLGACLLSSRPGWHPPASGCMEERTIFGGNRVTKEQREHRRESGIRRNVSRKLIKKGSCANGKRAKKEKETGQYRKDVVGAEDVRSWRCEVAR